MAWITLHSSITIYSFCRGKTRKKKPPDRKHRRARSYTELKAILVFWVYQEQLFHFSSHWLPRTKGTMLLCAYARGLFGSFL